mmetsp:Transcript_71537/g.155423  ORF Transcript_71537/g.155423 Transcript_71537/m.155423 type:complete len:389 (-) Transcript_71537:120-1286(-)
MELDPRRCLGSAGLLARILVFLVQVNLAFAWDKDGHEAIGMTTMSALQAGPVAQVKRLMHGRDAVDVASWAHKVNAKYPWTVELHLQRQPALPCKGADLSHCPGNRCLVKSLKHFYGKLVHKDLVEIDWEGLKLTDADLVKYLINLVGDLHQPMHFGLEEDDMGRNFQVMFRGKKVSLYDIWDREISQTTIHDSPGFWWSGWTHVQRTHVEFAQDSARWDESGVEMFEKWANESARFVCESVYRNPLTGRRITEELKNGVFHLSEDLFQQWKREMLSKMLVAGARTAIVLNSILKHREAGELHGGTAVSGIEEVDDNSESESKPVKTGRKADLMHGNHQVSGLPAFAWNLGIVASELVVFLLLMRSWQGTGSVCRADRDKLRESGKGI